MNFKIVVDSCCELPEEYKNDPRFEIVSLSLSVDDYNVVDDENFNQLEFLDKMASSDSCPKSACPSPGAYLDAYDVDADHVYVITLSSQLSGSYNSAMTALEMYKEDFENENPRIHVIDSESASVGELQIAMKLIELEEAGHSFEEIVPMIEEFRSSIKTYFVLESLDTFKKTGRIKGLKAAVVDTLKIKPVLEGIKGVIGQLDQGIGMRMALSKLVNHVSFECEKAAGKARTLMISHCNAPERAEKVKKMILEKTEFVKVIVINMRGVSTMYANDGGIIVTF